MPGRDDVRPTHLLLVRHGESEANRQGVWQGSSDGTLSPTGHLQARQVAERVAAWDPPVQHLYSSPLRRAMETAQPIAQRLGLQVALHPDLREIDLGQVSGLSLEEFAARFPDHYARWQDRENLDFTWPEGEQRQAFFCRVSRAVEEIVGRHPGEVIAVVAHGGTIRAALAGLLGSKGPPWWSYKVENASITHVVVRALGRAELLALGDVAHLAPLRQEEGNP